MDEQKKKKVNWTSSKLAQGPNISFDKYIQSTRCVSKTH